MKEEEGQAMGTSGCPVKLRALVVNDPNEMDPVSQRKVVRKRARRKFPSTPQGPLSEDGTRRLFMCTAPSCPFTCKARTSLSRHFEVQHENVRYQCPRCPKSFPYRNTLVNHLEAVHDKKKDICAQCNCPVRRGMMAWHIKTRHRETPLPHRCQFCERAFHEEPALIAHVNFKHLKIRNHQCPKCQKLYFYKNSLLKHARTCGVAASHPHLCDICGAKFNKVSTMKNHVLFKHTDVEPVNTCFRCGKTYKWRCSYSKHIKKCGISVDEAAASGDQPSTSDA